MAVWSLGSFAQKQQTSESAVQAQSLFIDALSNKMIGRYDQCITQLKEIISKQADNHAAWNVIAEVYLLSKKYDEALDASLKAVSLNPAELVYQKNLADIYHARQDLNNEILTVKKIQLQEPLQESHYVRLSDLYLKIGKLDDAIKLLDLMDLKKGTNEISAFKKAEIYNKLGKTKEAENALMILNNTFPDDLRYMHALAAYYVKIKKQSKAHEIYKNILTLFPGDEKASLALATEYKQAGNDNQYLRSIESLMADPSIPMDVKIVELIPYLNKAIAVKDMTTLNTIEKYAADLSAKYPKEAKVHAFYADVLNAAGKKPDAFVEYKSAIKLNQSVKTLWLNYLDLSIAFDEPKDFKYLAENAYDLFPNDPEIAIAYTKSLIKTGSGSEIRSMINAINLMTQNNKALDGINRALQTFNLILANQNNDAYTSIEQAKSNKTLSPEYFTIPAEFYLSNDLVKAGEWIEKGLTQYAGDGALNLFKAIFLVKNKKFQEAKSILEKITVNSNNAILFETLGDVLFNLKDTEAAFLAWKKASEINPFNQRLKKKITEKSL